MTYRSGVVPVGVRTRHGSAQCRILSVPSSPACILLPALLVLLTTMTDIGVQVTTHLYLDDSADVRIVQWRVLSLLNMHDVLFGVPPDRINLLKTEVGLTGVGDDIENPWLLTFLCLGVIGFPCLVASVFLFLWHLGRRIDTPIGWLIVISTVSDLLDEQLSRTEDPRSRLPRRLVVALSGFKSEQRKIAAAPTPVVSDPPDRPTAIGMTPGQRNRSLADHPHARRASSALLG